MNTNANTIQCPKCQTKIEITKAMTAQVESRIREEIEGQDDAQKAALEKEALRLADQSKLLAQQKAALEKAASDVEQKVKDGVEAAVAAQRAAIIAQARQKAEADLAEERRADSDRITELEGKLKQSKQTELDLRKRERTLEEEKASLELNVARRVKEETDAIRAAAKKQADDEYLLKHKETQEQNAALLAKVQELNRKLEQGSQQAQGEALELVLEEAIGRAFPYDKIEEIAKGVHGADVLQRVVDVTGLACGTILWESKNAKKWSPAWLPKLRQDQRNAKADICVLVTEVMPDGYQFLAEIDGVWLCTKSCAVTLGAALRTGLVELAKSRQASEGKQGKAETLYRYVTGNEFRQRTAGMVEPMVQMLEGLAKERRAMERLWAIREKQIEGAMLTMHGMYGDLQGILGIGTLPTLEQMDLPRLEGETDGGEAGGGEN